MRGAGAGEVRDQIDGRRARNGDQAGQAGLHRPLCQLVSPVPDDGEAGLFAQGRRGVHGPAVRGGQIRHGQDHGPRTDEEIRPRRHSALPRVRPGCRIFNI